MEKSEEEYFPGPNQEGGGEEDDGAVDVRRHLSLREEEKHQDLQRDSGREVGEIQTGYLICIQLKNNTLYALGLSQRR